MPLSNCDISLLNVSYLEEGPRDGVPVLLLHGWPDDARTWDGIAPALNEAGYRTIAPWLRGFGATRFLSPATVRSGQMAAMAQDALELMTALGMEQFAVVGHDWGARIAYILAALFPQRVTRCAAMSVAWVPGEFRTPSLPQSQAFWYQWFMATDRGAEVVRNRGVAFARFQWETWGPPGWFDDATFATTEKSFENPDWAEITLHAYRVRWGEAPPDPTYAQLEARQIAAKSIEVPTLMIQGGDDRCVLPGTSDASSQYFTGPYARHVLNGVGHFPTREAAPQVVQLLTPFLGTAASRAASGSRSP
jgi:pimeloyl-ACP methyl ester carboxylesterase